MEINTYNIISPVKDKSKPYFYEKRNCICVPYNYIRKGYRYYLECSNIDEHENIKYLILFSDNKLNINFRRLQCDNFGRYKLPIHGELLNYIKNESNKRANIEIKYIETKSEFDEEFDVYEII